MNYKRWYFAWKFASMLPIGIVLYTVSQAGWMATVAFAAGLAYSLLDEAGEDAWRMHKRNDMNSMPSSKDGE